MHTVDGTRGSGGGRIFRTALALSLLRGIPVTVENVRVRRKPAGLRPRDLACVQAAASVGDASVEGARPGSRRIAFAPRGVAAGDRALEAGRGGSATLLLQTVLPALLRADRPGRLAIRGGTHVSSAPPFDAFESVDLPILRRTGAEACATLERYGFGAGDGHIGVEFGVAERLAPLDLRARGRVERVTATVYLANLPIPIAGREAAHVRRRLDLEPGDVRTVVAKNADGPGNAVVIGVRCEHLTETFAAFGRRGVPAEQVAEAAVAEALRYFESKAPVGRRLAGRLLVPMAAAGGGVFLTERPSRGTNADAELVEELSGLPVRIVREKGEIWRVSVGREAVAPARPGG